VSKIRVNLYTSLRRYGEGSPSLELDITSGTTVGQVVAQLGIPANETHILFVDHRAATVNSVLSGGESVALFPAIGGG
jgi:sulfur-carrier protein